VKVTSSNLVIGSRRSGEILTGQSQEDISRITEMKTYLQKLYKEIEAVFASDKSIRYLLIGSIIFAIFDYILWKWQLSSGDIYVFLKLGIYPVKLLVVILIINTILAFASYWKEKEISYLLMIGNIIMCFLTLILEIFYLLNK
jgi:hypothetical protein